MLLTSCGYFPGGLVDMHKHMTRYILICVPYQWKVTLFQNRSTNCYNSMVNTLCTRETKGERGVFRNWSTWRSQRLLDLFDVIDFVTRSTSPRLRRKEKTKGQSLYSNRQIAYHFDSRRESTIVKISFRQILCKTRVFYKNSLFTVCTWDFV
jgi:hypothetical protein